MNPKFAIGMIAGLTGVGLGYAGVGAYYGIKRWTLNRKLNKIKIQLADEVLNYWKANQELAVAEAERIILE